MTGKHVLWSLAAFFAGALLMIVIRGRDPAALDANAHADMAAHDAHNAHNASATDHAGHGDAAPLPATSPPATSPPSIDHANMDHAEPPPPAVFVAWVCASDPMFGMSKPGACPLDGTPLVQRELNTADYKDLHNETCPIMGGQAKADIFALYGGKKVRFCCPGCDKGFFADADNIIKTLER
jgi:hypothetical protein